MLFLMAFLSMTILQGSDSNRYFQGPELILLNNS